MKPTEREEMALYIFLVRGHTKAEWYTFNVELGEKQKCLEAADILIEFFKKWETK